VPSDLYEQTAPSSASRVSLAVNGRAVEVKVGADGYVDVRRDWKAGDRVALELPMDVKRVKAHDKVEADRGRLAVERGPVVYCAEGIDNGGRAYAARIPADATFEDAAVTIGDKTFPALKASNGVVLVPYCVWGNREKGGELQTWF
ncbi:MAG: glycoside hydrolase family 127 protein, partial [Kiritimatiellae bacterium]|nr:glycoside hydrolase family 127 protein [Kiritimatiellia bacterium]